MDSLWLKLLLIVCTVLGGISAVVYFHDRLKLPSLANLKLLFFGVPKAPIYPSSISAYVHTNPRSRRLDQAIATDFGLALKRIDSDWEFLYEETQSLGLKNIRQLDKLVAKHRRTARLLAQTSWSPDSIRFSDGLQLVLEIEAMERFGADWYTKHLKGLKHSSTGEGYAKELWGDYQQVKAQQGA